MYLVVGLGNPGEEYENTRHNIGRMALSYAAKKADADSWKDTKKGSKAVGSLGGKKVAFLAPLTYMNQSGTAVKEVIESQKEAAKSLIVIYDDIDLPLGNLKMVRNRGSGGHNGVESVIRGVKTKDFLRIRVGICPATPTGKLKKPKGEKAVIDFLMGDIRGKEEEALKKTFKQVVEVLELVITGEEAKAMQVANSK